MPVSSGGRRSGPAAPPAAPSFSPVETTSFTAVKALVAAHGLELDPCMSAEHAAAAGDLGQGTPYVIRCVPLDDGRTLWQLRPRAPPAAPAHSPARPRVRLATPSAASALTASLVAPAPPAAGAALQAGDMLGAVLSTHPTWAAAAAAAHAAAHAATHAHAHATAAAAPESEAESQPASEATPPPPPLDAPLGPSVTFHPLTLDQWASLPPAPLPAPAPPSSPPAALAARFDFFQSHAALTDASDSEDDEPRLADDPRFAVWGVAHASQPQKVLQTSGPGSAEGSAGPIAAMSETPPPPCAAYQLPARDMVPPLRSYEISALFPRGSAALLAASAERLVAQLTSVLDTRLQTDFFYTFRLFMTSHTLLDLLLARLEWTFPASPAGAGDPDATPDSSLSLSSYTSQSSREARSVVRVRTMVVLRFWLVHFFDDDWYPDARLRSKLCDWLNAPLQAPGDPGVAGVLSALRKTVRRLQSAYGAQQPSPDAPLDLSDLLTPAALALRKEPETFPTAAPKERTKRPTPLRSMLGNLHRMTRVPTRKASKQTLSPSLGLGLNGLNALNSSSANLLDPLPSGPGASSASGRTGPIADLLTSPAQLQAYLDFYDVNVPPEETPRRSTEPAPVAPQPKSATPDAEGAPSEPEARVPNASGSVQPRPQDVQEAPALATDAAAPQPDDGKEQEPDQRATPASSSQEELVSLAPPGSAPAPGAGPYVPAHPDGWLEQLAAPDPSNDSVNSITHDWTSSVPSRTVSSTSAAPSGAPSGATFGVLPQGSMASLAPSHLDLSVYATCGPSRASREEFTSPHSYDAHETSGAPGAQTKVSAKGKQRTYPPHPAWSPPAPPPTTALPPVPPVPRVPPPAPPPAIALPPLPSTAPEDSDADSGVLGVHESDAVARPWHEGRRASTPRPTTPVPQTQAGTEAQPVLPDLPPEEVPLPEESPDEVPLPEESPDEIALPDSPEMVHSAELPATAAVAVDPASAAEPSRGDRTLTPVSVHPGEGEQQDVSVSPVRTASSLACAGRSTPASSVDEMGRSRKDDESDAYTGVGAVSDTDPTTEDDEDARLQNELLPTVKPKPAPRPREDLHHFASEQTLKSPSPPPAGRSPGAALAPLAAPPAVSVSAWPGVVQLDDVDLSSDDDGDAVRKALRRLPGARDLRHARQAGNLADPPRRRSSSSSDLDFDQPSSTTGAGKGGRTAGVPAVQTVPKSVMPTGPRALPYGFLTSDLFDDELALAGCVMVKGFSLDGFESEEEDEGGVSDALARLEGVITDEKRAARARKVEKLLAASARKMGTIPEQSQSASRATALPAPQDQLRAPSARGARATVGVGARRPPPAARLGKPGVWSLPPLHRSFILDHRSEDVAAQLCLIEAELFTKVSWREFASGAWRAVRHVPAVYDWEAFYRARMRRRVAPEGSGAAAAHDSALAVIAARFNLTANWIASEVVLTATPRARAGLVAKFIRIAVRCYEMGNFASVVQIVCGLQSPWVARLSRTWAGVPPLEKRVLRDLRTLASPAHGFRHLRRVCDDLVAQSGLEEQMNSAGPPAPAGGGHGLVETAPQPRLPAERACVPFAGLLLVDLTEVDLLPTTLSAAEYLDRSPEPRGGLPSALPPDWAPTGAVGAAAAAEQLEQVLTPLPDALGEQAPRLINVYKYRSLAMKIKTALAFQVCARAYSVAVDAPLYSRCLKLRCLPAPVLTQLSHMQEN